MPRWALLADVHGNRLALTAVLADLAQRRVDQIINSVIVCIVCCNHAGALNNWRKSPTSQLVATKIACCLSKFQWSNKP